MVLFIFIGLKIYSWIGTYFSQNYSLLLFFRTLFLWLDNSLFFMFALESYWYFVCPPWKQHSPRKWMVGRRSFPFGIPSCQMRTVSFREGNLLGLVHFSDVSFGSHSWDICVFFWICKDWTWMNYLSKAVTEMIWYDFHFESWNAFLLKRTATQEGGIFPPFSLHGKATCFLARKRGPESLKVKARYKWKNFSVARCRWFSFQDDVHPDLGVGEGSKLVWFCFRWVENTLAAG